MVGVDRLSLARAGEDQFAAPAVTGEVVVRDRPYGDYGTKCLQIAVQKGNVAIIRHMAAD